MDVLNKSWLMQLPLHNLPYLPHTSDRLYRVTGVTPGHPQSKAELYRVRSLKTSSSIRFEH